MSENPKSIVYRFVTTCVLVLVAIIALTVALDLLSRIWGWLLLIAAIALAGYVAFAIVKRRSGTW